tara:strand:+ start:606 stop:1505 length:900 start_codon:yes stop_codon:yes gene_type:complete
MNNIQKLFDCYNSGFQPPKIFDTSLTKSMKSCKVFYHIGDNISDVMRLVKEREPVNIAMERYYSEYKLNKYFNYKKGYYGSCSNSKYDIVPPNFIVYTPSLVLGHDQVVVHILNVIGLAFDSKKQRDYKSYMKLANVQLGSDAKHILQAKKFYDRLFRLIFNTALHLKKKNIVMSFVGANNFAILWKGGSKNFQKQIWIPTFKKVIKDYKELNIMFMGADISGYENLGFFPQLIRNSSIRDKIDKTLLINAWDCWSVPGNGNNNDNSLDGYIGRNTLISILGTSLTNPELNKKVNYIKL